MQCLFLLLLCSPKGKCQQRYLFLLSSGHRGNPCRNIAIFSCTGDKLILLLSSQGSFPAEILVSSSALLCSQAPKGPSQERLCSLLVKENIYPTLKKNDIFGEGRIQENGCPVPRKGTEGQLTTEQTEGLI